MMARVKAHREHKAAKLLAKYLSKVIRLYGSRSRSQKIARRTKDIQTLYMSDLLQNSGEHPKANLAEESPADTSSSTIRLAGSLTIQDRLHAIVLAYAEHNQQKYPPGHTVFWVDGSASDKWKSSGAAVVSRRAVFSGWSVNGYHIPQKCDPIFTELVAIVKALELTERSTVRSAVAPRSLTIYSDARHVLKIIMGYEMHPAGLEGRDREPLDLLTERAITLSHILKLRGVYIQLRWVPAHNLVPGHDLADCVARRANTWNGLTQTPRVLEI